MWLCMALPSPVLFLLKYSGCNNGGFHAVWSARCWPAPYTISAGLPGLGSALTSKEEAEALQFHSLPSTPSVCLPGTQESIKTDVND